MWIAPMRTGLGKQKMQEYENAMDDWDNFTEDTREYYGVNMRCLTEPFRQEQEKYYLKVNVFVSNEPKPPYYPDTITILYCLTMLHCPKDRKSEIK
jgi:hypothetical protein